MEKKNGEVPAKFVYFFTVKLFSGAYPFKKYCNSGTPYIVTEDRYMSPRNKNFAMYVHFNPVTEGRGGGSA